MTIQPLSGPLHEQGSFLAASNLSPESQSETDSMLSEFIFRSVNGGLFCGCEFTRGSKIEDTGTSAVNWECGNTSKLALVVNNPFSVASNSWTFRVTRTSDPSSVA